MERMLGKKGASFKKVYEGVNDLIVEKNGESLIEIRKLIKDISKDESAKLQQSANKLVPLYHHAAAAKPRFDEIMTKLTADVGLLFQTCSLKKLFRVVEKIAMRPRHLRWACDNIYDVVRGCVVVKDLAEAHKFMKIIFTTMNTEEEPQKLVKISYVKNRHDNPTSAGWADIRMNVFLQEDQNKHQCEV